MKVSLNEVRKFTDVDTSVEDLVQKIGAQLGAVEEYWQSGLKYEGVVVARVVSCEKHPNADKLSVCMIDDGGVVQDIDRTDGLVQVVCGAPNVRAGLLVAWLPPGSTVPSTYWNDPFVLGARELRGVISNGMLASPSELAISDNHDGILEIDEDVQPGTEFKTLYGVDDATIEIENKMFTHRPDCFGVLGVAREIAGIYGQKFTSPSWYLDSPEFGNVNDLQIFVENEIPELCARFTAVAMQDIVIRPSPTWLQALLTRVGIKPINNVVDVTNYLSYITAQPLHAYDYDKVKARSDGEAKLTVRKPKDGEQITLLNGKTITPRADAIMIATDKELVGVAGVMGGTTTEVDDTTTNIIIEVANFNMYSIRRTSMAHGLFTDAVTRFNKGQSPLQNDRVLAEAMKMMTELSGAQQASTVIDDTHLPDYFHTSDMSVYGSIDVTTDFINSRLGLSLSDEEICTLLTNVEFDAHPGAGHLSVSAPFWRTDIAIAEDIVEEVGRLLGFDKLPLELPKRTVTPTPHDTYISLKQKTRDSLAALGANEVLTYSFVHGKLIDKVGQDKSMAFKLTNALSPDLQYYRLSLMPSLLDKVSANIRSGNSEFALFELGKAHANNQIDEEQVPREYGRLSLVYAAQNSPQPAYYVAKEYLERIAPGHSIVVWNEDLVKEYPLVVQMLQPFEPSRSAMLVNDKGFVVGVVGEYTAAVIKSCKLPNACAGFEIFLSAVQSDGGSYQQLSRFPSVSQDICLEVSDNVSYGQLASLFDTAIVENVGPEQSVHTEPVDVFTSDQIPGKKRITYRVKLASYERTLSDEVLSNLLHAATEQINTSLSAVRI